ncbi:MAG: hypothetical protein ACR2LI_12425 [Propionibacteriaceae bacterium]
MSQLLSMVVPLHTLPGWTAPDPPWLEIVGLLLGLPLAVVVLFSLIGKLGAARHRPETQAVSADEPLWLGAPSGAGSAIPGGERIALPASVTQSGPAETVAARRTQEHAGDQVGGASARW